MFISKQEKKYLFDSIRDLNLMIDQLHNKLGNAEKDARKSRSWSPEQRAAASERMKKMHKAKARL